LSGAEFHVLFSQAGIKNLHFRMDYCIIDLPVDKDRLQAV
jgi:hypothetical protein